MRKYFRLNQKLLEEIINKSKTHSIVICGGRILAKEMRKKLAMVNVKVAFLISDFDDAEENVRHYRCIERIEDIENYHFIFCFDGDEVFRLYQPVVITLSKTFGVKRIKPKITKYSLYSMMDELAGEQVYDIYLHRMYLNASDGKPYLQYGGNSSESTCNIHVYGASTSTGNYRYTGRCWPEFLHEKLTEKGVAATVYNWSQSNHSIGDFLVQIMRNGYAMKPEIVILFTGSGEFDSIRTGEQNILRVLVEGLLPKAQVRAIEQRYSGNKNRGLNHKVGDAGVWAAQQKVFRSLCEFYGFKGLFVIAPSVELMPDEIATQIPGITSRHTARMKRLKDMAMSQSECDMVKDYSGLFNSAENIYDYYLEWRHYTDLGNSIIADQAARDVISLL